MASKTIIAGAGAGAVSLVALFVILLNFGVSYSNFDGSDILAVQKCGDLCNITFCARNWGAENLVSKFNDGQPLLFDGSAVVRNVWKKDMRYSGKDAGWNKVDVVSAGIELPIASRKCYRFEIEKGWGDTVKWSFGNLDPVLAGYNWSEVFKYSVQDCGLTSCVVRVDTFFPGDVIVNSSLALQKIMPTIKNSIGSNAGLSVELARLGEKVILVNTSYQKYLGEKCINKSVVTPNGTIIKQNCTSQYVASTKLVEKIVYDKLMNLKNASFFVTLHKKAELGFASKKWSLNISGVHLDPWWNTSWGHYKNITINSSNSVSTMTTLLWNASIAQLTGVQSDCDDVRILDTSGNERPYFKRVFSSSCLFYINVTSVVAQNNFTVYYNNSGATSVSNINTAFWKILAFLNLDDNGRDSRGKYNFTLTNGASANQTGKIGDGIKLDGNNDYLINSVFDTSWKNITFIGWVKLTTAGGTRYDEIWHQTCSGGTAVYAQRTGDVGNPYLRSGGYNGAWISVVSSKSVYNTADFVFMSGIWQNGGNIKVWVNNTNKTGVAAGSHCALNTQMTLGVHGNLASSLANGTFDEIKFFSRSVFEPEMRLFYAQENSWLPVSYGAEQSQVTNDASVMSAVSWKSTPVLNNIDNYCNSTVTDDNATIQSVTGTRFVNSVFKGNTTWTNVANNTVLSLPFAQTNYTVGDKINCTFQAKNDGSYSTKVVSTLQTVIARIAGTVKNAAGAGVNLARVYVIKTDDNTIFSVNTTNSTGHWYVTTTSKMNFTTLSFLPTNRSLGIDGELSNVSNQ